MAYTRKALVFILGLVALVIVCSVAGHSVPSFVLGLVLVLLFAVNLNWLPSGGADNWKHAILPVVTLGTAGAAIIARFTRSAMLEVLGQPYVRAALAKGVPWPSVRATGAARVRRDGPRARRASRGARPNAAVR